MKLGSSPGASDVVSESVLSILQTGERFEGRSAVGTFVYAIVMHKINDYLRDKYKRAKRYEQNFDDTMFRYEGLSAFDILYRKETKRRIEEIMMHLTLRQRQVVNMFYFGDISVVEIADILGISKGRIYEHLGNARRVFRRKLKEWI